MIDFSFKEGALVELITDHRTFVGRIPRSTKFSKSKDIPSGRLLIKEQILVRKEGVIGTINGKKTYHVNPESVIAWRYAQVSDLGKETPYSESANNKFIPFDKNGFSKHM